jgi:DNA-binding response OmpR family regulator
MTDRCSVLVTEDDPALRKLVATALRRRRIDLETAADGREALTMLAEREWLVLVLDLMMPAVSGFDVIAWMAENPDRKPASVIVVSAMDQSVLSQLNPSVVNAIIFKPFDIVQLATYVKTACELQHGDRRKTRVVGGDRGFTAEH